VPPSPLRVGSSGDRDALIACFTRAAFREAAVCRSLAIPSLDGLDGDIRANIDASAGARDILDALVRLFVVGMPVDQARLESVMTPGEIATFIDTDLIRSAGDNGEGDDWYAPVRLVPLSDGSGSGRELLIASDRPDDVDGIRRQPFSDVVFSGHNPLTRQFLSLLPRTPAAAVLDLCSGTGVAALAAARTAPRLVCVDVTDRATHFANFNRWINGAENVEVRRGNLFEPVAGEWFDRIVAHPPYVPTLFETAIYRDGGETGDQVLREIVRQAPQHLCAGGTFHFLSIGLDTASAPFEARVREWLGESSGEFDIIFGLSSSKPPKQFARTLVDRVNGSNPGDYDRWLALFDRLQVRDVVYGALVGRRIPAPGGNPQTRRVVLQTPAGPDGFDRLLRWFDYLRRPDRVEHLLASRPVVGAGTMLDVHYELDHTSLTPRIFRLTNDGGPFKIQLETDGWVIALMNEFTGDETAASVCEAAQRERRVPDGFEAFDFCELVCFLAERGLLQRTGIDG
jgi:SAM-dependent methyltransferase